MLHITNGDSVLHGFREGMIPGEHLSWADPLHDGPVPQTDTLHELSEVRARALTSFGWGPYEEIRTRFTKRDHAIENDREHEEVVLWFEHDLYDQLQLLQVLDWFAAHNSGAVQLSMIQIGAHPEVRPFYGLGELNGRQLAALLPQRTRVTKEQLALASEAWAAFRAPEPEALKRIGRREWPGMPFLGAAVRRFLEEYPATGDGLSRTERQILRAAADGWTRKTDLYRASQQFEECPWGDASVYLRIERLARGARPALDRRPGDEFAINENGTRLLAGAENWLELQGGIDVWLGGVHLTLESRQS